MMALSSTKLFLPLVIFAVVAGGCQATTKPVVKTNEPIIHGPAADPAAPAVDQSHRRARLILGQDVLLGRLKFDTPRFRRVGNFTQAQVELVNQTQSFFELEYRVDWKDAQGFVVEEGAWRRFTLAGHERYPILTTGGTPGADQIAVTVRLPQEVF